MTGIGSNCRVRRRIDRCAVGVGLGSIGRFPPHPTSLAALINIGKVLVARSVVIAHADRERISQRPLHLSAVNADRNVGMGRAVDELDRQRVDVAWVIKIRTSQRREGVE